MSSLGYALLDAATNKILQSQNGAPNTQIIYQLSDFPTPIGNVITLLNNTAYLICASVNLGANRIVCGQNTVLCGLDSSISKLISTQSGIDVITTTQELFIEKLTISTSGVGSRAIYANGDGTKAIRIRQSSFLGCRRVGTVNNYYAALVDSVFLISCSQGWDYDGAFFSIIHDKSGSISSVSGFTYCSAPSSLTVTNRLVFTTCAFDCPSGVTGLSINGAATIPLESYVVVDCAFKGAGSYTAGLDENSSKSFWKGNIGIFDSYIHAGYYISNGASATTISNTTTYFKVVGNTLASDVTGFTLTANKALYTGAKQRKFLVTGTASFSSAVANQSLIAAIAVNGIIVDVSRSQTNTNLSSQTETFPFSCVVTLNSNDYVELYIRNTSTSSNVTWVNGNLFITEI